MERRNVIKGLLASAVPVAGIAAGAKPAAAAGASAWSEGNRTAAGGSWATITDYVLAATIAANFRR